MGIPDSSLLDLIEKVRSWIPWGGSDISGISQEFWIHPENSGKMCWECETHVTEFSFKCHCKCCGRVLCGECMQGRGSSLFASDGLRDSGEAEEHICKFCFQDGIGHDTVEDYRERIDSSPRQSPERGFHCFDREKFNTNDHIKHSQSDHLARFLEAQHHGSSPRAVASSSSSTDHPSLVSFRYSSSRSDEEDAEDSRKQFFSPSSEFSHDISDIDSSSISARHEFYCFKSVGSSPLDSPCRMTTTPRAGKLLQHEQEGSPNSQKDAHTFGKEASAILRRPEVENQDLENTDECSDDMSTFRDQYERVQQPLDFESNGLIWFPPPPDDDDDDVESDFFKYDDEDDDVGGSGMIFSSSSFSTDSFPVKEKSNEEQKEPLRAVVHGHFRALVSQLLQGEGISVGNESIEEDWLDIVSSMAWQAANFVKPDTSRGGSMDPGDYVKVKCIVSGCPNDSTLIKGVVCTKNIKHKRMTSQYRNPRLLLLGGSIEYQRASDQLASFNTLLQQEIDHLKMVVSKIEAHRPNVLLVEKSVSSYAQEYLLAKEISLVLNVKRPLLERIARCTGALVVPSIDNLSATRLGHCEVFRLERLLEDCATANQPNKKSAKTLMFFEGCPRRLGCTVLLKGASREVLKKVKHVVQYAVFAAYHLSLETSFLADEGATLPEIPLKPPAAIPEKLMITDGAISVISNSAVSSVCLTVACQPQDLGKCSTSGTSSVHLSDDLPQNDQAISSELQEWESSGGHINPGHVTVLSPGVMEYGVGRECSYASNSDLVAHVAQVSCSPRQWKEQRSFSVILSEHELLESSAQEEGRTLRNPSQSAEVHEITSSDRVDWNDVSSEYFSTVDNHQSILVSFSSRCVLKGIVCERSQLLRIKFYGSFDKPLGRYLRDDLFDQTSSCRSCKEPTDAHVLCYTHQQGNLTINVKRLPSLDLPGERDGKIWMWHRCLKCAHKDGVPPATRRVVMSDAAWGLSFGKFLELSFSNHATANRVASCGHSLQRDCLRYYGFGSMVAFFRYSPIDILSVHLPHSMLEFNGQVQMEWVKREAAELFNKMEVLYAEVFDVLHRIEQKGTSVGHKHSDAGEVHDHIMDLKDLLKKERNAYEDLLQPVDKEDSEPVRIFDILELNRLRRCLLIDSFFWDRRLYALDSLLRTNGSTPLVDSCTLDSTTYIKLKEWRDESFCKDSKLYSSSEENNLKSSTLLENPRNNLNPEPKKNSPFLDPILNELTMGQKNLKSDEGYSTEDLDLASDHHNKHDESPRELEVSVDTASLECLHSPASSLSEKIDSAWTGTGHQPLKDSQPNGNQADESVGQITRIDNPSHRRLMAPARVYSFDSAVRLQERINRGLSPTSLHLSSVRSFHASGDYMSMVRDPVPNMMRTFSQTSTRETQKLKFIFNSVPSFISSASQVAGEGVRLLLPQTGHNNMVLPVYDNEPTSVISYALGTKEYEDWVANKSGEHEGVWSASDSNCRGENLSSLSSFNHSTTSTFSVWQSSSSIDADDLLCRNFASEDASSTIGSLFSDHKRSPHARISFGDEFSSFAGKAKFSVICYFARQFDALRKSCCPSEMDFIRSLSRGKRWNAQGGKSNVYFAKSLDDRFIIKQITKTELDSFEEFAPEYFKYLMDSLSSRSPTSLAKVLGIYQVSVKHLKGGRETKIDLMVMENLFFKRNISRVYDLKGSARSRYNSDTTGKNKVLLDMNLLETLRTNPMFLGSKAKRSLERAVWNDTSFLASVDVMDYSLLVGVDEEKKELVLGIIDFMRQYTWDKHLETWVKASGILGGPKNASPTVISPKQYKKRFRKAMSTYFLTVPDQWSS